MPLVQADARAIPLEDQSVQCVVTSPPYWGLRDYGQVGQLGLEKTPEEYVEKMVTVFREVRRVLRDDGTCWLNIGDSYATAAGQTNTVDPKSAGRVRRTELAQPNRRPLDGLKPKDLVGIPWRLAFALQADGWYLRSDTVWAKGLSFCPSYSGSVMPESVTGWRWERHQVGRGKDRRECPGCATCRANDGLVLRKGSWRPTRSHEYLFLLTKTVTYFCDKEAVKEVGVWPAGTRAAKGSGTREGNRRPEEYATYTGTRNLRSVWAIGTKPFKAAHFATFPPKLVEPCIKAGTSEKGCCGECGGPWVRVVERSGLKGEAVIQETERPAARERGVSETSALRTNGRTWRESQTTGWRPSCTCPDPSPLPCIVLDPFAGSGTVGLVCRDLKRLGVCCDLKLDYLHMARERLR